MPRWLQGMLGPTLMLWFFVLLAGVATGMSPEGELPRRAASIASVLNALLISWWVMTDARKRQRRLFYDYGMYLFFAWPIVVPVYLFQTRGWRALLTLLCFAGIWMASGLLTILVETLREVRDG